MNTLFPIDDAAPLAGGAGVKKTGSHSKSNPATTSPTPPARHDAPETSRAAADRVAKRTPTLREMVLDVIRASGPRGMTDAEMYAAIPGEGADTLRPRRRELVKLGDVIDSGSQRITPKGCRAVVWVAVEHAEQTEGVERGGGA